MRIEELMVQIKRQESPSTRWINRFLRGVLKTSLPAPKSVFMPLFYLHHASSNTWDFIKGALYSQPMFRARCESCGHGLTLLGDMPHIEGDLRIWVGEHCGILGKNTYIASRVFDNPSLRVGDHSFLGFGVEIVVAKQVRIGNHVLIAGNCFITDNPGHPTDPIKRRDQPVDKERIQVVTIEDDVWLGSRSIVLPGTHIGHGSIIGAGAVVSKTIPPYSLVIGNPGQVIRSIYGQDRDSFRDELQLPIVKKS